MRVLFSSTRGAGHLLPLLPYARALLARGHEIVVAAPADVSATLREAGLPHAPFDHPGDDALAPIWARLSDVSNDDGTAIVIREIFAGVNPRAALSKLRETIRSWRPDLIVRESVEFAAAVAADAAGVPHARVAVHSVSFEERIPALSDAQVEALRLQADLPPDGGASLRAETVFSCFPASVDATPVGSPMRPPVRVRVAEAAPAATKASRWTPGNDDRPLVYITFGTVAGTVPRLRSVYRTALDAVDGLPVRALLTIGAGMEAGVLGAVPANVHVEAWVPQREVLPRAAAVVCHGGAGTVLGTLAAGVPMVVVPTGADQPHNAQLVAAAGAGIALSNPDAATLRAALQGVLGSSECRRGARRIADEIAALPTLDHAVDVMAAQVSA